MQPPGIMPPSQPPNCVTDWIRGLCPADTLVVWFPAHWAPMVIRKLREREQEFREANNLWFDQPGTEAHLRLKKWEAQECRSMKFRLSNFGKSEVPLLSCAIRVEPSTSQGGSFISTSLEQFCMSIRSPGDENERRKAVENERQECPLLGRRSIWGSFSGWRYASSFTRFWW